MIQISGFLYVEKN